MFDGVLSVFDAVGGCVMVGHQVGVLRSLSAVTSRSRRWVWEGLVPSGSLTLLMGDAGVGKSFVALQVAASVTRGLRAPLVLGANGDLLELAPELKERTRSVVVLSAVDAVEDTVLPRLKAAGADVSKVFVLGSDCLRNDRETLPNENQSLGSVEASQGEKTVPPAGPWRATEQRADDLPILNPSCDANEKFCLSRDLPKLEASLRELKQAGEDVGLIVIDPIDSYFSPADNKRHRAAVVSRLAELAAEWDLAILVISNSSSKLGPRGKSAIFQELENTARSVLMVAPDLDEEGQRVVIPVKSNLSDTQPGIAFSIVNDAVRWNDERVFLSSDDYAIQARLKVKSPLSDEDRDRAPELRRVTRWLKEQLLAGRASSGWLRALAAGYDVAYSTLRRAYKALGCRSKKDGRGQWFWYLPSQPNPASEELINEPLETPEGISGITREFTPDNFTKWFRGRDPEDAIFAGADSVDDELPPMGSELTGDMVGGMRLQV